VSVNISEKSESDQFPPQDETLVHPPVAAEKRTDTEPPPTPSLRLEPCLRLSSRPAATTRRTGAIDCTGRSLSCPRVPASDWAAEIVAGSVTFCDIVRSLLCSRWRICPLGAQVETLDRLCLARRARTFPLPEFYNMRISLIPTAAVVALSESTTQMDFGGGDGWVMSQNHRKRQETGGLVRRGVGRPRPNLG